MSIVSKNKLIFAIITILVLIVAGGIFFGFSRKGVLSTGEIKIGERIFKVEVAKDMMSRSRGLSGRESLGEDEGMFFIFDSPGNYGFWMKGMKFAIDIVWIHGDKIVGFAENVQPELEKLVFSLTTYYPPEAVDRVLEVSAGTVGRNGFKVGDQVVFGN